MMNCRICGKFPCKVLKESSTTLSGNQSLNAAIRDMLMEFTEKVGCQSGREF